MDAYLLTPSGSAVVALDSIEYIANARRPQLSDIRIKRPLMRVNEGTKVAMLRPTTSGFHVHLRW